MPDNHHHDPATAAAAAAAVAAATGIDNSVTSPASVRLILPKNRLSIQRRATVTGASPTSSRPPLNIEQVSLTLCLFPTFFVCVCVSCAVLLLLLSWSLFFYTSRAAAGMKCGAGQYLSTSRDNCILLKSLNTHLQEKNLLINFRFLKGFVLANLKTYFVHDECLLIFVSLLFL